jgi:hypothetical protein
VSVTAATARTTAHNVSSLVYRRLSPAWIVASGLALYLFLIDLIDARTSVLQRGDEGLLLTTVTYTVHGQIPITDYYQPYGLAWGLPGAIAHWLGFTSVLAIRITYGLFPPLVTLLATVFVWRRTDWKLGVLVGLVSFASQDPSYSMGYAALFAFLLMVDRLAKRTPTGSLHEVAARFPHGLIGAAAVLSLAAWARVEYASFGVLWAVVLVIVLRGRDRIRQAASAVFLAALPTLIVLATGGATHLWWIIRYLAGSGIASFRVQRGRPIDLSFIPHRLDELAHFQLSSHVPGLEFGGAYGVGLALVLIGICLFLVPATRRRILADKTYLTPFLIALSAVVLYGLTGAFNSTYSEIGAVVIWAAAALLLRRIPLAAAIGALVILAWPLLVQGFAPGSAIDTWSSRPAVPAYGVAPGLKDIPVAADLGGRSMDALARLWRALGLQGRPMLGVARRNDVFWSNDMIMGYLVDAPPAAWPLTYDPGVINRPDVERATVQSLCHNRAPVVQFIDDYPYYVGTPVYVGSRYLDEFLAIDYGVRALAGYYRILLPATSKCVLPESVSDTTVRALRDRWITRGEMPAAGALAVLLMDRARAHGQPVDPSDAAIAALGGYRLLDAESPPDPLAQSLYSLTYGAPHPALAAAAAQGSLNDIEALAATTAWIKYRTPGPTQAAANAALALALAVRHPNWPLAIQNVTAIIPPSEAIFRELSRDSGTPAYDQWRWDYYVTQHQYRQALSAGLATIADYNRMHDPLNAGQAEATLAKLRGLPVNCSLLLLAKAAQKPGSNVPPWHGALPACSEPEITGASL